MWKENIYEVNYKQSKNSKKFLQGNLTVDTQDYMDSADKADFLKEQIHTKFGEKSFVSKSEYKSLTSQINENVKEYMEEIAPASEEEREGLKDIQGYYFDK